MRVVTWWSKHREAWSRYEKVVFETIVLPDNADMNNVTIRPFKLQDMRLLCH